MYLLANCDAKLLIRFRVYLIMILESVFCYNCSNECHHINVN